MQRTSRMEEELDIQFLARAFYDACFEYRTADYDAQERLLSDAWDIMLCVEDALSESDADEREWQFRMAGAYLRESLVLIESLDTVDNRWSPRALLKALKPLQASLAVYSGAFVGVFPGSERPIPDTPEKMH